MNEKRILLVHGIHAKEGESNVWNMKKPLEQATGLPVVVFEYGFVNFAQARFQNPAIAKRLAHIMLPGDIVVNHSNGAAVTWLATHKEGARPAGVVMLQPALDEWRMPICDWAHVYYNPEDSIVWWSGLLFGNIWGAMGRLGYRPNGSKILMKEDSTIQTVDGAKYPTNIHQVDTINDAGLFGLPEARGHLAVFQSPDVQPWGRFVGSRILDHLQGVDQ